MNKYIKIKRIFQCFDMETLEGKIIHYLDALGESNQKTLCDLMGMRNQSNISMKLDDLIEIGAIRVRREGREKIYKINGATLMQYEDAVDIFNLKTEDDE